MTSFNHDIETLKALGPIEEAGFVKGTYALRLDLHCPAPLHKRPAQLDPYLDRAAGIMGDALAFYAGEHAFAYSAGRKSKAADVKQLGQLSAILQADHDENAAELATRRAQIEATGTKTYDHHFQPVDSGTFYLGDRLPLGESGTHIQMLGFGAWALSLSFGLDLAASKTDEIMALATDIMASGIASSGGFGFAINPMDMPDDMDERFLLGPTRRFAMLNPVAAAKLSFDPRVEMGIAPVACWYALEDEWARENGLDPDAIQAATSGKVHSVTQTENGRLYKLWPTPVLADHHDGVDLSPAIALGAALAPAMEKSYREGPDGVRDAHGLDFLRVGSRADRWRFYTRFQSMARHT